MARKTVTQEIDGLEVTTTQFGAIDAFALLSRLGKVAAPLVGSFSRGASLEALIQTDLMPVMIALCEQLSPDVVRALCKEILDGTVVKYDGKMVSLNTREKIDAVFGSNLLQLMRTLKFALEVNYSNFFSDVKALVAARALANRVVATEPSP